MFNALSYYYIAFALSLIMLQFVSAQAHSTERRVQWNASSTAAAPVGRLITRINPESALIDAGLKVDDILLAIDDELITNADQWSDILYGLRAGVEYQVDYKRKQITYATTLTFTPAPKESFDNIVTDYGFVTSDYNIRQRTIVTYPSSPSNAKLPAVFILSGLSCSSIEQLPGRTNNFLRTIRAVISKTNMLVMRIEKPGVGDSEGRCSQTDFKTELNGYEVALQTLLAHPKVNPDKVVIFGSSMGSALAPYLANKYKLNGVIADGTFYRSWFEHMLEIERRILTMQGNTQSEVTEKMNKAYIPLYYGMLIEKKSFQTLVEQNPFLKTFNYHSPEHKYGRSMAYYHQIQDFDFAGQWSQLKAAVRVRWGSNDWIMSEYDIDMIGNTLLEQGHSNFQVVKYEKLDHWYTIHDTATDSFEGKPGRWEDAISQQIVDWTIELNQ